MKRIAYQFSDPCISINIIGMLVEQAEHNRSLQFIPYFSGCSHSNGETWKTRYRTMPKWWKERISQPRQVRRYISLQVLLVDSLVYSNWENGHFSSIFFSFILLTEHTKTSLFTFSCSLSDHFLNLVSIK